jgi:hypothetical protein
LLTLHQITFYQIGRGLIAAAFLQSEQAYRDLQAGDVFRTSEFPGLDTFSAHLEVMHVQHHASTISRRGKTDSPRLIVTRAYDQSGSAAFPDFAGLMNQHMAGDM